MPQLPKGWIPGPSQKPQLDKNEDLSGDKVLFRGRMYKRCPAGYVKSKVKNTCIPQSEAEREEETNQETLEERFKKEFDLVAELDSGSIYYNPQTGQTFKLLEEGSTLTELEQEFVEKYGGDVESVNDRAIVFQSRYEINLSSSPDKVLNDKQKQSLTEAVKKMHSDQVVNGQITPDNVLINENNAVMGDFSQAKELNKDNKFDLSKDIQDLSNLISTTGAKDSYQKLVVDTAKELRQAGKDMDKVNKALKNYMDNI